MIPYSETPVEGSTELLGGPYAGKQVTITSDLETLTLSEGVEPTGFGTVPVTRYRRDRVMVPSATGHMLYWVWIWTGFSEQERQAAVLSWFAEHGYPTT